MPMKNPPHPGHSIKDACLEPLGLSVTKGAKVLGVARHTLSGVINGQAAISPEMAIRLEKAGWSTADHWLGLQSAFDLAQARRPTRMRSRSRGTSPQKCTGEASRPRPFKACVCAGWRLTHEASTACSVTWAEALHIVIPYLDKAQNGLHIEPLGRRRVQR